MKSLRFADHRLDLMPMSGDVWVRGSQIGTALGYSNPAKKINELYRRHADEFTASMTAVVQLPDLDPQNGGAGQAREVRVFSLRGAHLLAMFARTKAAKQFRRWVLDVLDSLYSGGERAVEQYREAVAELEKGKEAASGCGRGLSRWKQAKTVLTRRVEYWQERCQLALDFH